MITNYGLDTIRAAIPMYTGAKRLAHTLSVEEECIRLAGMFGLGEDDKMRLRAAALLHDITKKLTREEQLGYCDKNGISYTLPETKMPKIFHSLTGAHLAAKLFPDIADEIVCGMIKCHTTAKPDMTLCEALLYLADYIEPKRSFDDCIALRKYFYERAESSGACNALAPTLVKSFDMTIGALLAEGSLIHENTNAARNFYLSIITESEAKQ